MNFSRLYVCILLPAVFCLTIFAQSQVTASVFVDPAETYKQKINDAVESYDKVENNTFKFDNRYLSLPTHTPTQKDIDSYNKEKKNIAPGYVGWFVFPSLGHAVEGDWRRGAWFLAADILAYYIAVQPQPIRPNSYGLVNANALAGIGIFVVSRVWEFFDLVSYTNSYNDQLKIKYNIQ